MKLLMNKIYSKIKNREAIRYLLWKIDNISTRITEAEKGEITVLYSTPAYTDCYGYKFCARIYLSGDGIGKDDHISLFFILMKSEYNDLLEWPFYEEVTCRLFNPDHLRLLEIPHDTQNQRST